MSSQARCCEERDDRASKRRTAPGSNGEIQPTNFDCIENEGTCANRCRRSLESVK